ncbi:unnamed protein product [Haemonchus placei]|uniref:Plasmid stabilization protein n=1 Tax=Haemonchus placei TaxID=6290 RepID=A0A0N4W8Y2_HAEPC|nr:unnamed protein product [Haemonchus placei]
MMDRFSRRSSTKMSGQTASNEQKAREHRIGFPR